ncbi:hypothetical protein [Rhizobium sp. BK251]|uniref:hypothetical protein n=1 Tax=Rhizobium sp. BK251 TaxID=2512125 RepID=UPI0010D68302|nr:hypothetical protein [Rhizobium sp. BK251]TCL73568.1 hypothetical protein EV286_10397 [Rhizobium sp. BK251]
MDQANPPRPLIRRRLAAARPQWQAYLIGAPCWGVQMALSAALGLYLRDDLQTSHAPEVLLLYFLGGLLSWPFVLPVGLFFAHGRAPETRFASFFVVLAAGTVAMTAFLFALDYRFFYARWHAPFGSMVWIYQFLFTSASAVYQFAVLGVRLLLPLGLLCLFTTSFLLARRMR